MTNRVRVNLTQCLRAARFGRYREADVEMIVRFRSEHGPIADGQQLRAVLGGRPVTATIIERADLAPSDSTAPEAPRA
jgi:hypothetical protein